MGKQNSRTVRIKSRELTGIGLVIPMPLLCIQMRILHKQRSVFTTSVVQTRMKIRQWAMGMVIAQIQGAPSGGDIYFLEDPKMENAELHFKYQLMLKFI